MVPLYPLVLRTAGRIRRPERTHRDGGRGSLSLDVSSALESSGLRPVVERERESEDNWILSVEYN